MTLQLHFEIIKPIGKTYSSNATDGECNTINATPKPCGWSQGSHGLLYREVSLALHTKQAWAAQSKHTTVVSAVACAKTAMPGPLRRGAASYSALFDTQRTLKQQRSLSNT